MNLIHHYYYFKNALSPKSCDDIISHAKKQKEQIGITGSTKKDVKLSKKDLLDLKKVRDSNVVWLNDKWIYNLIHPYIHEANKEAGWNFQWDWSESCQFTKYKINQHYDWHCDSYERPYENSQHANFNGKIRKLSVTCSLSDPLDYEGGELEFNFNVPNRTKKQNIVKCKEIIPRGSIVVFPSHVWHRVCPVKKGTRYSLVMWNLGYPFK
jgi:PKHD-type hydroxylase